MRPGTRRHGRVISRGSVVRRSAGHPQISGSLGFRITPLCLEQADCIRLFEGKSAARAVALACWRCQRRAAGPMDVIGVRPPSMEGTDKDHEQSLTPR